MCGSTRCPHERAIAREYAALHAINSEFDAIEQKPLSIDDFAISRGFFSVGPRGLEPRTSSLSGMRSNRAELWAHESSTLQTLPGVREVEARSNWRVSLQAAEPSPEFALLDSTGADSVSFSSVPGADPVSFSSVVAIQTGSRSSRTRLSYIEFTGWIGALSWWTGASDRLPRRQGV